MMCPFPKTVLLSDNTYAHLNDNSYIIDNMDEYRKKQLIIIVSIVSIFLLTRAFWLWFWKVNMIEAELGQMTEELQSIKEILNSIKEQNSLATTQ